MDPLSITASLLALITACAHVNNYLEDVRKAPEGAKQLQDQVLAMQNVLLQLTNFLQKGDKRFASTSALVQSTGVCERQLDELLKQLQKVEKSMLHRVVFPLNERDIKRHIEALRGCTSVFELSLTISGCALMSQTTDAVSANLLVQIETSKQVAEMTRGMQMMYRLFEEATQAQKRLDEMFHVLSSSPNPTKRIDEISDSVNRLELASKEERETTILNWLTPRLPSTEKHGDIARRRTPETGGWLTSSSEFRQWVTSDSYKKAFVCVGGPGVGKTFLTSTVIDFLRNISQEQSVGVSWCYSDYRGGTSLTATAFAASLVRQFTSQLRPFPQSVLDFYDLHKNESSQRNLDSLNQILVRVCSMFSRCYICVDALDEVEPSFRREYLNLLKSLQSASAKVFVTTRPHLKDVSNAFVSDYWQTVEARSNDIKAFVADTLAKNEDSNDTLDDNLREETMTALSEKAGGMFLLASLQLNAILDQVTKSGVRAVLRGLSSDLKTVFETFFERIKKSKSRHRVALAALTWLAYARRPLSVDELRHGLATDPDKSDFDPDDLTSTKVLVESCLGLVSVEQHTSTICLVHVSLQEYLEMNRQDLFPDGESILATACLKYSLFPSLQKWTKDFDINSLIKAYPLLAYSYCYWGEHAECSMRPPIREMAMELLTDVAHVQRTWKVIHWKMKDFHDQNSTQRSFATGGALHCVAMFGLASLVPDLVRSGEVIEGLDEAKNTPLHVATYFNREETVKVLLEQGASVNKGNSMLNTPLYVASAVGNENLVRLLLQFGANPNKRCRDSWTSFHKAADQGYLEIVKLLLDNGGSISSRSSKGLLALHRACGQGHLDIVKLLISLGSNINDETYDGWTPLHGAANSGKSVVIEFLIQKGADINHVAEEGYTPLHRACLGGHIHSICILLRFGADTVAQDYYGETPLHKAAERGHEKVVELLLNNQPETRTERLAMKNNDELLPCHVALVEGHYELANLLSPFPNSHQKGCETKKVIRSKDQNEINRLIIQKGQLNHPEDNGLTPFHQSISDGNLEVASYLAKYGALIEIPAMNGWTPLHTAAQKGNVECVKLCLEYNAQVTTEDTLGRTPLHQACSGGNVEIVRLLIEHNASLEAEDSLGYRPIHSCAKTGQEDVARMLVLKYNVYLGRGAILYPLELAVEAGHYKLAEFFRACRTQREWWEEIV